MRGVYDVRNIEIHTAVFEISAFEIELAIEKIKSHKSPGNDQIPPPMVKAGSRTICPDICKLINFIWNKEKPPYGWKKSINVPIYKKGDETL